MMSEGTGDFLDSELLNDAEATNQRPALSPEADELKTTQLPPLTPPPPPPAASMPPLPPVTFPQTHAPTFALDEGTTRYRSEPPQATPKPSWLRALLTTTFPPPSTVRAPAAAAAPITARTAGTLFAVMGLVFAVVALVSGLRGVPSDAGVAPAVAAALVITRALVALGAGALSFAMFRQAERLLVQEPPRS